MSDGSQEREREDASHSYLYPYTCMAHEGYLHHAQRSLAASTLSALSNASSSLSQSVDLEIVDEIINRAPRSATSFGFVYSAYNDVLEEQWVMHLCIHLGADNSGISSAADTAYYHFLLKLGTARVPTWGEKWDLFKATQGPTSPGYPQHQERDVSRRSSRPLTRARVPFLASASSDLDQGFDGEDTYDGDESVVSARRPSPRRVLRGQATHAQAHAEKDWHERSRSLVGYTPSQSIDFDALEFNPPARTSTPVFAQIEKDRHLSHRKASLSPPPYSVSVSDVSGALATDQDEDLDGPSTPRVRAVRDLEDVIELDRWDEQTQRQMDRRADDFYEIGLMGRCWDMWAQSYHWVKSTTDQIDRVRSGLLLRQALQKWRKTYEEHQAAISRANKHHETTLQRHTLRTWVDKRRERAAERTEDRFREHKVRKIWAHWRAGMIHRRTMRWQKEVSAKERAFRRAREANTLAEVFTVGSGAPQILSCSFQTWHDAYRDKVGTQLAEGFFVENTLRQAFDFWLKRARLSRTLGEVLRTRDEDLLTAAFGEWQHRARISSAEREVLDSRDERLVRRTLTQWREVTEESKKARVFLETRLKRDVFAVWTKRHRKIKVCGFQSHFELCLTSGYAPYGRCAALVLASQRDPTPVDRQRARRTLHPCA